jgi:membrane-bound lytic murein transglycosylase D
MRLLLMILCIGVTALPGETRAWLPDRYQFDVPSVPAYEMTEEIGPDGQQSSSIAEFAKIEAGELHVQFGTSNRYTLDFSAESNPTGESAAPRFLKDTGMEYLDLNVPNAGVGTVNRHVQFFSYHIRDRFEQWLSRLERYRPTVQGIFSEFKLPLDLIFLSLVESGFNTNAVSRSKAVGPWQFITPTAKTYGLRVDHWIDERRDPVKSTIAAAQYLRDLYHLFGSWPLAMAAYNAGEGKVGRSLARVEDGDFWALRNTKLLKSETREYVPRFLAAARIAKDPGRFGFSLQPQAPVQYDEVTITRPVHLRAVAKAVGMTYEEIKNLNPELRRDVTPPDPVYLLKVPAGKKAMLLANLPTYRSLYPVVYTQPKRAPARFQPRGKETLGLARLAPHHRRHKTSEWLPKVKPGAGKPQVLAKSSR